MKVSKFLFVAAMAAAVSMTSCLDNVSSDYTPEIHISQLYLNPYYLNDTLVAEDTLNFQYSNALSKYVSDSISVGDTAMIGVAFYSLANNLTALTVSWDTTAIEGWLGLNDAVTAVLSDTTQVQQGYLPIIPGYNMVTFPMYLKPLKSGVHNISLTVESDSKYSPKSETFGLTTR